VGWCRCRRRPRPAPPASGRVGARAERQIVASVPSAATRSGVMEGRQGTVRRIAVATVPRRTARQGAGLWFGHDHRRGKLFMDRKRHLAGRGATAEKGRDNNANTRPAKVGRGTIAQLRWEAAENPANLSQRMARSSAVRAWLSEAGETCGKTASSHWTLLINIRIELLDDHRDLHITSAATTTSPFPCSRTQGWWAVPCINRVNQNKRYSAGVMGWRTGFMMPVVAPIAPIETRPDTAKTKNTAAQLVSAKASAAMKIPTISSGRPRQPPT
jgi:hypothetical protein